MGKLSYNEQLASLQLDLFSSFPKTTFIQSNERISWLKIDSVGEANSSKTLGLNYFQIQSSQ